MHSFLVLLALFVQPPSSTLDPSPSFPIGEHLTYEGCLRKGGVLIKAGRAVFSATRRDDGATVLMSAAWGKKLGYTLDTRITTVFEEGDTRPSLHHYVQRGSEFREKKLVFGDGGAVYLKLKHCRESRCTLQRHQIKKVNWVGIVPWGTHEVHCQRRHCKEPAHLIWRERGRHDYQRPFVDLLTAVYFARTLDLEEPGESQVIPVVHDRDRWLVTVTVRRKDRIETQAGTFNAVEVVLTPAAIEGKVREEFKGLFGLHGAIHIWLDTASRRPVLVTGKIPFAFLNFDVKVELVEIGTVPGESG